MPRLLAAGGELRDRAARRRLRRLAAGVRVDLGVEHEDVDVAARREHVVEAAEADVVGPAVAADDPDALADERAGERLEPACLGPVDAREPVAQLGDEPALLGDPGLGVRVGAGERRRRGRARARPTSARACRDWASSASRMPRPNSALSSNSEFDQAGPRPSPFARPRRRRQVAAVDRRAAGGVGDEHPVAEAAG